MKPFSLYKRLDETDPAYKDAPWYFKFEYRRKVSG